MERLPENVRQFSEVRAESLTRDVWRVGGEGQELEGLPAPDDFDPVPSGVLEAFGYYCSHVGRRDNGRVYVFRAVANGTPIYGVLTTSDGGDDSLEVYNRDGGLLGAARMDSGFILWRDREAVRLRVLEGGLEPELLAARRRRMGKSS